MLSTILYNFNEKWNTPKNMYNSDTELLFPLRLVPELRNLRGKVWQELIDQVSREDTEDQAKLAFSLLMVRLGSCVSCNPHSFRAMRGCTHCAKQTIKRYRGTDEELVSEYKKHYQEIDEYNKKTKKHSERDQE